MSDSASVEVTSPGSYILIVTNLDNGCSAEETLLVDEDIELPNAEATASNDLDCDNNSVTLDGSNSSGNGPINYEWFDEDDDLIGTNVTTIINSGGIYTLVVTNQQNGCTDETEIVVNVNNDIPVADGTSSNPINCELDITTLDGSDSSGPGDINYEWFDPSGNSLGTTVTIDVMIPGTYVLVVTDPLSGCWSQTDVEVVEDMVLPIPIGTVSGILTCSIDEVTLDGSASTGNGTLEYEWQDNTNTVIGNTAQVIVNSAGVYNLYVTDNSNGCINTIPVVVNENYGRTFGQY